MSELLCWCGNQALEEYSPDYKKCGECGTLVCSVLHQDNGGDIIQKSIEYYNRDYWFEHQTDDLNFPDLPARARKDLPERVIYWLEIVLDFCLPPAKALEIGCGHGGFVAMLRQAGFDASGLELSPWVVDYAENQFNVPMYQGPIEKQSIKSSSLDFILLMDVFEHFKEPVSSIKESLRLLKPNGKIFIQTPAYNPKIPFIELQQNKDPFQILLNPPEHVYLFSKESIRLLLNQVGLNHVRFLKPFFLYDMYFVASSKKVSKNRKNRIEKSLLSTPGGRITQAMIDLNVTLTEERNRLVDSDKDRAERLSVINHLEQKLIESERDRTSRLKDTNRLEDKLVEVEADRTARLTRIHELDTQIIEIDKDRTARLDTINKLGNQLEESEKDRAARLDVINELNEKIFQNDKDRKKLETLLNEIEAVRKARLDSMNDLETRLRESEADRTARLKSVNELEKLLQESEADRKARLESMNDLESKLRESEADRDARLVSINKLEKLLAESEADRDARLSVIANLEEAAKQRDIEFKNLDENLQKLEKNLLALIEEKQFQEQTVHELEAQVGKFDDRFKELLEFKQMQTYNVHRQAYYIAQYEEELSRFPANILRRVLNKLFREKNKLFYRKKTNDKRRKPQQLKKIVVDLTPILPGGENGGAKPMTTALIWQLSRVVAPEVEYLLLTSDDAHDELSWLDGPNVQRICVNQRQKSQRNTNVDIPNTRSGLDSNSKETGGDDSANGEIEIDESKRKSGRESLGSIRIKIFHVIGVILEILLPRKLYSGIYRLYKREISLPEIKRGVNDFDADLLFCPFTAPFYHKVNIPTVIVVYDLLFKKYPQFFSNDQIFYSYQYLKESCEAASQLICISDFTRKMLLDECEISSDGATTIPISMCNPIEKVEEEEAKIVLQKLKLVEGRYFLYPANFWHHKNHEMLLTAYGKYLKKHPDLLIKLVFTGTPGERMAYLEDVVDRMGLSGTVVFAGYLDIPSFSAVLQNSFAMIFPSLFEGFGIPLLEAMSFGIPVLSSNLTSLPEVGGDAVHYFDPRKPDEILESIEIIVDDEDYRQKLIDKGISRLESFLNPVEWAQKYLDIFQTVVNNGKRQSTGVNGIFPDHWASESIQVFVPTGEDVRFLEMCIKVPEWFPHEILIGSVTINSQRQKKIKLRPGQLKVIRYSISGLENKLSVKFNRIFQPKNIGINDDERDLSCRVMWCRLLTPDAAISIYESGLN